MTDPDEVFARKVIDSILPVVFDALGGAQKPSVAPSVDAASEPDEVIEPTRTIFSGTFDEIQDYFDERGWSDGLPVVPPTLSRVDRFLKHTSRNPREVLGVLLPERREATVWSVAVNGVMAGCRPEYMPVLIAIVEAIADPAFHIQDAGSTPAGIR